MHENYFSLLQLLCYLNIQEINIDEEIPPLEVKKEDFRDALKNVEPSAMREVFLESPQVKCEDVGECEDGIAGGC